MVKVTNIFGDVYSGQAGKAGVFARWKGRQYRRKYVIPANPNTTKQQAVRGYFTNAVGSWHAYSSLQRLCYGFLAVGQVLSGFNLLVSRWQKKATKGQSTPEDPPEGIKQIGSASTAGNTAAIPSGQGPHTLDHQPIEIGTFEYTPDAGGVDAPCFIDIRRGLVHVMKALTGLLTISYEAGGRVVTDEEIGTDLAIETEVYLKYWPVDFQTCKVKLATVEQDAIEVDSILGKIFFTTTGPTDTSSSADYTEYTALADAKLECTKVDTSFITWRGYSDANGLIEIAQTIEDQNYDFVLIAADKKSEIRANRAAAETAGDELIVMEAA
ncbi:hypothetical protein ES703_34952 [subsurface metagenome]